MEGKERREMNTKEREGRAGNERRGDDRKGKEGRTGTERKQGKGT